MRNYTNNFAITVLVARIYEIVVAKTTLSSKSIPLGMKLSIIGLVYCNENTFESRKIHIVEAFR